VPDGDANITSDAGWDTVKNQAFLKEVIVEFQNAGIRTSIFVDPVKEMIEGAAATGTDRIELYTENFAVEYGKGNREAVKPYTAAAQLAHDLGMGVNAGHDLSLENISLYLGLENVVNMYIARLENGTH
jgi:pyridoxine 5-phosphate synthase